MCSRRRLKVELGEGEHVSALIENSSRAADGALSGSLDFIALVVPAISSPSRHVFYCTPNFPVHSPEAGPPGSHVHTAPLLTKHSVMPDPQI